MENISDLKDHLAKEHKQSPFAEYLKEIVYGGIDGIVTTFAVVAGFSGAQLNSATTLGLSVFAVLLFGFANLFGDAVSMALGNFLSTRTEKDIYRQAKKKEVEEIKNNPESEVSETIFILQHKGFSEQDAKTLTEVYRKNPEYWAQWMMDHELNMANPEGSNPALTALATFFAFIAFGSIPLLPYLTDHLSASNLFTRSIEGTLIALILLGIMKGRIVEESFAKKRILRAIAEVVIIGGLSASVAFLVGTFFHN